MSLNTHSYDGKLSGKFNDSVPYQKDIFDLWYNKLTDNNAKIMAKNIEKCIGQNFDDKNNIDALSLLMYIIQQELTDDIFKILEEQLSDTLISGQCAQGRTTRLFQVYNLIQRNKSDTKEK